MSDYFQRLVQQSELQVQSRVVTPPPSAPVSIMPAGDVGTAGEFAEVHEERVVDSIATPPAPARVVEPNSFPSATSFEETSTIRVTPAAEHPAVPTTPPPTPELRAQPIAITPTTTVVHESAQPAAPTPADTEQVAPPTPAIPPRQVQPPLPSELMDAVMKWIAAGSISSPQATDRAPNAARAPAAASVTESESRPEAPPPRAQPSEKIPERVIRLVEAPPAPAHEAAPLVVARPIAPAASRPASPPAQAPVRVSIGSIQVNVEAPAPAAPKPLRPSRPAEPARTSRPIRSSTTSQLRRHYIIPH